MSKNKRNRKIEAILLISMILAFIGILYIVSSIDKYMDSKIILKTKIADLELNIDILMIEGCDISCNENNLSYESTNYDVPSCYCSNEDGRLYVYKPSIDKIPKEEVTRIMNQHLIEDKIKEIHK